MTVKGIAETEYVIPLITLTPLLAILNNCLWKEFKLPEEYPSNS